MAGWTSEQGARRRAAREKEAWQEQEDGTWLNTETGECWGCDGGDGKGDLGGKGDGGKGDGGKGDGAATGDACGAKGGKEVGTYKEGTMQHEQMSVTKSWVAAIFGMLYRDGFLSWETQVFGNMKASKN